ncbi:MAG TPA: hypothetical protein VFE51_05390 [Verrucomicrobiae bacterium]|nr:hypothetical protein [Verrucomicrobiae bacterium]
MSKVRLQALALAASMFLASRVFPAGFADAVVDYNPGTGFAAGFTNAASALGAPTGTASPFSPPFRTNQIVSLGAGGSLTLHLADPAVHSPASPYGIDFEIFGNSFFIITNGNISGGGITDGNVFSNGAPTRVEVSADGVTWFTLNPAQAPTIGDLFPTDGSGDPEWPVDPGLTNFDFAGLGLAGIRSLYQGSGGGAGFNLDWAQDTNGDYVNLPIARFIRLNVLSGKTQVDAVATTRPGGTVIAEDFAFDPAQNGWRIAGDPNLFHWDSTNQDLKVTWDSSRPNSYFYHPLGTILSREDDFTLAFDLRLGDIGPGLDTNKTSTFAIGIGFLNLEQATGTNFIRGTGDSSPDLAEFSYFWDSGFGATCWPTFVDTNSTFNYNAASDYAVFTLASGDSYHVVMSFTASNQTAVALVTNFEHTTWVRISQLLNTNFADFRLGAVSISSYSDAGQDPQYAGSVLAHGIVDNLVITVPAPPVQYLVELMTNGTHQVQFVGRANWLYTLERTSDLKTWTAASSPIAGANASMFLADTNLPPTSAIYRVQAHRYP